MAMDSLQKKRQMPVKNMTLSVISLKFLQSSSLVDVKVTWQRHSG